MLFGRLLVVKQWKSKSMLQPYDWWTKKTHPSIFHRSVHPSIITFKFSAQISSMGHALIIHSLSSTYTITITITIKDSTWIGWSHIIRPSINIVLKTRIYHIYCDWWWSDGYACLYYKVFFYMQAVVNFQFVYYIL